MEREIMRRIIIEGQEYIADIPLVERPFSFEENGNYVFVGIRQAGKSYLLYQRIQQLIRNGHSMEEMLYINFDDERLRQMTADDFDLILQAYASLFDFRPILFFDEIQNIEGWENFARRVANQKYQVYITGSNAKMLSREIATILGGRFWNSDVYPYSFAEYLTAKGVRLSANWLYGKQGAEVGRLFGDYFMYGGFPELVDIVAKRAWLNAIYSKIFFSDLVLRNKVRNEDALGLLVHRLAEVLMQPVSHTRLANQISSAGIKISTATVVDFMRYLKEACLIFSVENQAAKFAERNSNMKYYFVDNGLLNIFLMDNNAALLENIVAIHLYKRYGNQLHFYQHNIEVDFVLPEEKKAYQASCSLTDTDTYGRETGALLKLHAAFPMKEMYIITKDEERTITIGDRVIIKVLPVWQWLLL
ncbi:MAG: ATP-binding protein [Bacteroides sp.]|nr:ATP-binding protein [Bacteroides sp.]